jgi:formylglycine-generating enzyme required for sulfatase activity
VALAVGWATFRGTVAYQAHRQQELRAREIALHLEAAKKDSAKGNYTHVDSTGDSYASALQLRDVQEKLAAASTGLLGAASEYREVLRLDPGNAEVLGLLADTYARLWKLAFFQGNTHLMESYAQEVKSYAGPVFESRYGRLLRGDGSLALTVANADAEAHLFRFEQDDAQYGRLVLLPVSADGSSPSPEAAGYAAIDPSLHLPPPITGQGVFPDSIQRFTATDANRLGSGPARSFLRDPLPLGSYVVVLTAPGHLPIRIPFLVDRDEHGAGRALQMKATLPDAQSEVPGFSYVPQVEALLGSRQAAGTLYPSPKRQVVHPFYIQTGEVSVAEYLDFLNALVAGNQLDEARARLPKSFDPVAASAGRVRADIQGQGVVLTDPAWSSLTPAALAAQPISGVTWLDAQAYAGWRSARDHRAYRLPTDEEWEVAARGADGRTYSWGEIYRPEAARLTQGYGMISVDQLARLQAAHSSYDESVFGVRDLAGSVAEWVGSDFVEGSKEFKSIRGNAWGLTPNGLQCAFRATGSSLNYFHSTIGFRLAMDAPPEVAAP